MLKLEAKTCLIKVASAVLLVYIASFAMVSRVNAQTTVVSILPSTVTIDNIGQTVKLDLNITGVTNLYGYEIKIWYLNSIVNATEVIRPSGHFLEPVLGPDNYFVAKWEIKNDYNTTHGRIWIAYTLLSPEPAKNGSGILARITFKGLSIGQTPIILNNQPGASGPVKLADNSAQPIPHVAQDGSVVVIPEFSSAVIIVTALIIISAAYIIKLKRPRL